MIDTFPVDLTPPNTKLPTIPEEEEINIPMPFPKLQTMSWADLNEIDDYGIFHPYDRLNFKPTVANWLSVLDFDSVSDADTYDAENDRSPFCNPMGEIVYYNQEFEEELEIQACSKCQCIQMNNVLLEICQNSHYLCTECFYQEKRLSQNQNIEHDRQQRQKVKNPVSRYQFCCPSCNQTQKLLFNIYYQDDNEELVIIRAFK